MPDSQPPARSFWRRRVLDVIVAQLRQGITPQKVALTLALGVVLGIFPILGATTLLCLGVGLRLRLNQPILQAVNYLVSGLQLALILVFVRAGEWLLRAPRVSFSIPQLFREFHESPLRFIQEFGLTGLHGILAWLLLAPFLTALIYFSLLPLVKKLGRSKP